GGGLPVGAYGGRADLMKLIAPEGPVYQAGTRSGNPLAMTAGTESLKLLKKSGVYRQLEERGRQLGDGLNRTAREAGIAATLNRVGSMMTLFFTPGPVTDYASAKKSDTQAFAKFFRAMLSQGVYLPPSQFEAAFLSTAHTPADLNKTLKAARAAFTKLKINYASPTDGSCRRITLACSRSAKRSKSRCAPPGSHSAPPVATCLRQSRPDRIVGA